MREGSGSLPHTERRNPRSRGLDQLSARCIVQAIAREDATVAGAVAHELPQIARAVEFIAKAIENGGRLIYAGAGTSGRLAMLDAVECPPTFGTPPDQVGAVIAGGPRALASSVEGAEDSAANGRGDLARLRVSAGDVVVGLSASGATPYVLGALRFARRRGAKTIAVTSNRHSPLARAAHISIAPETGPELIAGSTRMKAGTAQKMVLNMLSTGAMVRAGRIYDNWMIGVAASNHKLRARGLRILEQASGAAPRDAERALRRANDDLRVALVMLKRNLSAAAARQRLRASAGNVRRALSEARQTKSAAS
jgi:N-acetylmuramic acid 6-phosphate etherase